MRPIRARAEETRHRRGRINWTMKRLRLRALPILGLAALLAAPVAARDPDPNVGPPAPDKPIGMAPLRPSENTLQEILRKRLDTVLALLAGEDDRAAELSFSEVFLASTPRDAALASLREHASPPDGYEVLQTRRFDSTTLGAWVRARSDRRKLLIVTVGIEAVQPNRLVRLSIRPAPEPGANPEAAWRDVDNSIAALPFTTALAAVRIERDGTVSMIHARDADARLGIGTMGTLFIHLALAQLVDEGGASWDQPLMINDTLRSLPENRTSRLVGAELPLKELSARAMIENDNTAADHLATFLGRERIELARDAIRAASAKQAGTEPPPGGEPFLLTLENLRLKCGATNLIARYAEANSDARRRLLETDVPQSAVDPTLLRVWTRPQELTRVGWTASTRELALVAARLVELSRKNGQQSALDALRKRHGDAARRIAGEPGALASLWIDARTDGRTYVLAITFNSDTGPIPENAVAEIIAMATDALSMTP